MYKTLVLFSLLLFGSSLYSQPQIIAHRGFWDCEGSAQNSLVALHKAHEVSVYGSEFDVLLTADSVPVVNHDNAIRGKKIENTLFAELRDYTLKNGELLPTLEQYLVHGKSCTPTKLILEIKPHSDIAADQKAARIVATLVKKYEMEKQVDYISFSLEVCKELVKLSASNRVAYLKGDLAPSEIKDLGLTGIDYHYSVFVLHPNWIAEAKQLGLTINVWTVNSDAVFQSAVEKQVDYITTDKPLEYKKQLEALNLTGK